MALRVGIGDFGQKALQAHGCDRDLGEAQFAGRPFLADGDGGRRDVLVDDLFVAQPEGAQFVKRHGGIEDRPADDALFQDGADIGAGDAALGTALAGVQDGHDLDRKTAHGTETADRTLHRQIVMRHVVTPPAAWHAEQGKARVAARTYNVHVLRQDVKVN